MNADQKNILLLIRVYPRSSAAKLTDPLHATHVGS